MTDLKKYFEAGDKIQIQLADGKDKQQYLSQIEEIHDDDTLDILTPIHKGRILILMNDAIIRVIKINGDAIYEIKTKLIKKIFAKISMVRLEAVSEVTKIQRRNYFRLKSIKDVIARKVLDIKENQFEDKFKGIMLDISGGGLMISTTVELDVTDVLEVTMSLSSPKELVLLGSVVRKTHNPDLRLSYSYGVRFDKISEFERNEIMKFIFEEQRKLIKKGLI